MRKFYSTRKFHLIIFLFSFLALTNFNFDPDLGWHLAYGERFLDKGEIILSDPFSWTMQGYNWVSAYFLYQIVTAFLISKLGFFVTALVFGVLSAVSVMLVLPKRLNWVSVLLSAIGVGVTFAAFGVKPHVFDFLFFAILLVLIERKFYLKKMSLLFWMGFFGLWANFHTGFILGIVTLTSAVFLEILRKSKFKAAIFSVLTLAFSLAGSLLNPFGYKIWPAIFLESGGISAWMNIEEFLPLPAVSDGSLMYAISGVIFVLICKRVKKDINLTWLFLASFLFILPLLTSFFGLFWGICFISISTRYFKFKLKLREAWQKACLALIIIFAATLFLSRFGVRMIDAYYSRNLLVSWGYPVEALDYMRKEGLVDGVLNMYGWGGYMIWQVPEIKVFIDGRMAGWKTKNHSILADFLSINYGNCEVALRYPIKTLLLEPGTKPACFDDFKQVYKDEVAEVWTKK